MTQQYMQGLAREVVVWRQRGYSITEICRCLKITRSFVHQSIKDPKNRIIERDWSPDFSHINDIGGY